MSILDARQKYILDIRSEDYLMDYFAMKYDIGNWVKEARLRADLSQEKLALSLDVSGKGTVSAWEKNKNAPAFETMVRISDLCGYPLPYIEPDATFTHEKPLSLANGYIQFQLFDIQAAAGNGVINCEFPDPVRLIEVSEKWARENLGKNLKSISIVTASGDSMMPTFQNGDLLFVDEATNFYDEEGIYVFVSPGGLKVKRLSVMTSGDLKVISDNGIYGQEILKNDAINALRICGKVVATLKMERLI